MSSPNLYPFKHQWTISGFSFILQNEFEKYFNIKTVLPVHGHENFLELWPAWDDDLSVNFGLNKERNVASVICGKVWLVDKNGRAVYVNENVKTSMKDGYFKLISLSDLKTRATELYPNDTLVVECEGVVSSDLNIDFDANKGAIDEALALVVHQTKSRFILPSFVYRHFWTITSVDYFLQSDGSQQLDSEQIVADDSTSFCLQLIRDSSESADSNGFTVRLKNTGQATANVYYSIETWCNNRRVLGKSSIAKFSNDENIELSCDNLGQIITGDGELPEEMRIYCRLALIEDEAILDEHLSEELDRSFKRAINCFRGNENDQISDAKVQLEEEPNREVFKAEENVQNRETPNDVPNESLENENYQMSSNSQGPNNVSDSTSQIIDFANLDQNSAETPPDGGYGWVVASASSASKATVDGTIVSFAFVLPVLSSQFNVNTFAAAWVGSLMAGLHLLMGPAVNALSKKFGQNTIAFVGGLTASAGFALSALATSLTSMMLTFGVLSGIGLGMLFQSHANANAVGSYFNSRKSLAQLLATCGSGIGMALLPLVTKQIVAAFCWRKVMLTFSGISLCGALFGWIIKPFGLKKGDFDVTLGLSGSSENETLIPHDGAGESGDMTKEEKEGKDDRKGPKCGCCWRFSFNLFKRPSAVFLFQSAFFFMLGFYVPFTYISERAKVLGFSPDQSALIVSLIGIAKTVGQVACNFLSQRQALLFTTVALLTAGIATILSPILFNSYFLLCLYAILYGFFIASFSELSAGITEQLIDDKKKRKTTKSMMKLFQGVAALIGSPLAGWLFDITGSYDYAFYMAEAWIALSGSMVCALKVISLRESDRSPVEKDSESTS